MKTSPRPAFSSSLLGPVYLIIEIVFLALPVYVNASSANPAWDVAASSRSPNPRLEHLKDGEALDLGPYSCSTRAPELNCETIFDYSRINYDPVNGRFLAFGGGHAATGRTDIDSFDLDSLSWNSVYPSMKCVDIESGRVDKSGFHVASMHPLARHTYDQTVVADINSKKSLVMFSTEAFRGHCHPYKAQISAIAFFSLDKAVGHWTYSKEHSMPWGYSGAAEFDPLSGMIVLTGGQSAGMWIYDPHKDEIVAKIDTVARAAPSSNLIYVPFVDKMFLLDRKTMQIRAYRLDRSNWTKTKETVVVAKNAPLEAFRNLAYDSRNRVFGGIHKGVFHAFDPATEQWSAHPIYSRSQWDKTLVNVRHHAIDYDPLNNVFVLISGKPGSLRTWAYRFKSSG